MALSHPSYTIKAEIPALFHIPTTGNPKITKRLS
nr:MAG TPA: EpoB [Caudoviricetes sp.]